MAAEEHAQTPGEYIIHHLTHFGTGKPKGLVDFSVINFDSVVFSAVVGMIGCYLLWRAARKATSGVPGRFQAAVEMLFELVDNEAKGIVHNASSRKMVAPLALLHIGAGWAWAVFHILILTLQAFVFMMLTLVYIGQAHDAH